MLWRYIKGENTIRLSILLLHFGLALLLWRHTTLPTYLLVRLVGYYHLAMATVFFISYLLKHQDALTSYRWLDLTRTLIHGGFAWIILLRRVSLDTVLFGLGWYFILLALSDTIEQFLNHFLNRT